MCERHRGHRMAWVRSPPYDGDQWVFLRGVLLQEGQGAGTVANRAGLERLIRYCARPPFALDRLHLANGRSDPIL